MVKVLIEIDVETDYYIVGVMKDVKLKMKALHLDKVYTKSACISDLLKLARSNAVSLVDAAHSVKASAGGDD